ncbi:MAG: GyrI-like domain-containing protein [Chloroflexi bacterium]|nr:GyrI-like domain-containing protein [Chloroflexota bacterium]
MTYTIEVEQQPRQPYVAVRTTVRMADIGQHMGLLFGQLFGWLEANSVTPIGPPWARYLGVGPEEVEFEVGVPVAALVEASSPIIAGIRPATTVAKTLYVGPYDGMEAAYSAVTEWLGENGKVVTGAMWEVYETDPEREPDPAKWRTWVHFPI